MFHATAYKQSIENLITTYFSSSTENANKVWVSAFRMPCVSDSQTDKAFQYIAVSIYSLVYDVGVELSIYQWLSGLTNSSELPPSAEWSTIRNYYFTLKEAFNTYIGA